MKNNIVLLMLVLLMGFEACTSSNTSSKKRYSEEDLIYRYLDTYCKDSIHHTDYKLLTFRTKGVCRSCRKQPIEAVLDFVVNNYANVYVLFDEEEWLQKAKNRYGDKVYYLLGDIKEMDRYGIPALEPVLFVFENNKIIDYEHFENQ